MWQGETNYREQGIIFVYCGLDFFLQNIWSECFSHYIWSACIFAESLVWMYFCRIFDLYVLLQNIWSECIFAGKLAAPRDNVSSALKTWRREETHLTSITWNQTISFVFVASLRIHINFLQHHHQIPSHHCQCQNKILPSKSLLKELANFYLFHENSVDVCRCIFLQVAYNHSRSRKRPKWENNEAKKIKASQYFLCIENLNTYLHNLFGFWG